MNNETEAELSVLFAQRLLDTTKQFIADYTTGDDWPRQAITTGYLTALARYSTAAYPSLKDFRMGEHEVLGDMSEFEAHQQLTVAYTDALQAVIGQYMDNDEAE